jgi:hypothetical protein
MSGRIVAKNPSERDDGTREAGQRPPPRRIAGVAAGMLSSLIMPGLGANNSLRPSNHRDVSGPA